MREGGHEEKSNMIAILGLNTHEGCRCETPPFDAPCDPPEMVELEQLPYLAAVQTPGPSARSGAGA